MTALAPFEPCPIVDLDTRAPLNQSAFFHRASHDPESNEAMAASLVPAEPRLELVHSGEPHVVGGDVLIPAADFAAILASIDMLRERLLSYQRGGG